MIPISAAALAFGTAVMAVLVLRPLAVAVGLVDLPDARKAHHGPVPLVGGIAVFVSVAVSAVVPVLGGAGPVGAETLTFLTAGLLLVLVGMIDDLVELSARARFVAQALAALVMIFGAGNVLSDLGGMTLSGATLHLGLLAVPFTIFTTIGVINALNMCDGLDGLSGSQTLVSVLGFSVAVMFWGDPADFALLAVIGAGICGFLLFNMRLPGRSRASIFMGDAGSMFLGFALTWFAISLSQGPDRAITPASALWFVAIPIIDAVAMMLRRILRGRSPFAPDREHLHHIFLLAGYSVNQTVAILAGLGLAGVAVGLASTWMRWPELLTAGVFLAVGLLYLWVIMHAWRVMRFFHRSICRRRSGLADRRALADRRQGGADQQRQYSGPERRCGVERRQAVARRTQDSGKCRPYASNAARRAGAAGDHGHAGESSVAGVNPVLPRRGSA